MPPPAPASDASPAGPRFPVAHPWDRNFHLAVLAVAWIGILMGFGGSISHHIAENHPPYPFVTHVHAVVFTGWLVLFSLQVLLVRWRNLTVHRQLGVWMAGVAVVMVILGPATALHKQHLTMNEPGADPAFLSIQLTDLVAFAGLVAAGLMRRADPAAHRRLMLLGTIYITDAGFARWFGDAFAAAAGGGLAGFWAASYGHTTLLMLSLGAYNLFTRRRFHPAWVRGMAFVAALQAIAITLYHAPWWKAAAQGIIAAFPWSGA